MYVIMFVCVLVCSFVRTSVRPSINLNDKVNTPPTRGHEKKYLAGFLMSFDLEPTTLQLVALIESLHRNNNISV